MDAITIARLINFYAEKGKLLRRSVREIARNIGSFFVAVENDKVVGCVSLDVYSRKMAEIRSLAVDPHFVRCGIGKQLVAKCIEEAKKKKILELLVITSEERFFQKLGFNYTLPGERKALFFNP